MKIKQLATAALGALALCGGMAFESNKAQAQSVQFACVRGAQGGFLTVVSNGRVTESLITWNSYAHSGQTPASRCRQVTQRFNDAFTSGNRVRITAGTFNGQGVICGLQGRERSCDNTNLLITFSHPRGASNSQKLQIARQGLNDLVAAAAGGIPLAQSGSVTLNDWADAALNSN